MKKATCHIAAIAFVGLMAMLNAPAAESLSVLLQKGIFAEETEGNLDAAIKIYEEIVKEGEANRSLVAQAQYRLGVCLAKKGKMDQAEAAFRKIAERFPGENELLAMAQKRLRELKGTSPSVVLQKVWEKATDLSGRISPDGRFLSFVDWDSGDLAVRDLKTGKNRQLTDNGSWQKSSGFADASIFSPDGKQLAYSWCDGQKFELRIISLDDTKPRVLLKRNWIKPRDWSPDGTLIAAVTVGDGTEFNITLISASDGSARIVKRLGGRDPGALCFSPDGRFIAYSSTREGDSESDLLLLDLQNGVETAVLEHQADDHLIGWVPSGNGLLLSSDRRGSVDLWFAPISKGKLVGELVLLKSDFASVSPLGLTQAGGLYYGVSVGSSVLYEARVDVSTGKQLSPAKEIRSRFVRTKERRTLSPDGRFLAYTHRRGSRQSFHVEDLKSGQSREIPMFPNVRDYFWPRWSEDSRHLLVRGMSQDSRNGLYLIDRITGETSALTIAEPRSNTGYGWMGFEHETVHYSLGDPDHKRLMLIRHDLKTKAVTREEIDDLPDAKGFSLTLSADGKVLFYIRKPQAGPGQTDWLVIRRDWGTGNELEILRSTNPVQFWSLEPRTDRPFAVIVGNSKGASALKVFDVTENSAKERFSVELPKEAELRKEWFGSKPYLLFTKLHTEGPERVVELWSISGENGEIRRTELAMPGMAIVGTHGDDRVFVEKTGPALSEVWVMENFLSAAAAAK